MRAATEADMLQLVEWARAFHGIAGFPIRFVPEAAEIHLRGLMAGGCILMTEHGAIGGAMITAPCDPDWRIAVEMFWWAEGDGLKLLRGFESWATANGASEIRMSSIAALPKANAILRHVGYTETEISYARYL